MLISPRKDWSEYVIREWEMRAGGGMIDGTIGLEKRKRERECVWVCGCEYDF